MKPPSRLGWEQPNTQHAVHRSVLDLHWAAGFIEGEGCFTFNGSGVVATAGQKEREPLARLLRIFGGNIYPMRNSNYEGGQWFTSGSRARGVMLTLYVLMGARRRAQIREAFAKARAHTLTPEKLTARGERIHRAHMMRSPEERSASVRRGWITRRDREGRVS